MKLYIHSSAHYLRQPTSDTTELRDELKSISQKPYRRISKFIYLSLIGAIKCSKGAHIESDTAVYLASNYGSVVSTVNSLSELHAKKSMLMPIEFINTAANIAGFYVASHFELLSKNICISSDTTSFQKALKLAYYDIQSGETKKALVGGVDEVLGPLGEFCRYTPLQDESLIREGSCWLFVSASSVGAIGEINFDTDEEVDFVSYDAGYVGKKDEGSIDFYKEHGYYGTYPAFVCSYFLDNFGGKTMRFVSESDSFTLKAY